MITSRTAVSQVVTTVFLLTLVIVGFVGVQLWDRGFFNSFIDRYFFSLPADSIEMRQLSSNTLWVRNYAHVNLTYDKIKIGSKECDLSGEIKKESLQAITLNTCLAGESVGPKEVVIFTPYGTFFSKLYLSSMLVGDISSGFEMGTTCSVGNSELYALEYISNSHAQIISENTYTYTFCISHSSYTLNNLCSGNHATLFYLDNDTNAHIFTDTSSPYKSISTWNEICLSSNAGVIDVIYNASDMSSLEYSCIGSYSGSDTYGAHMGDCNWAQADKKIWVKIT